MDTIETDGDRDPKDGTSDKEDDAIFEHISVAKKLRLEQQDLFKTLVLENAAAIDEQQEKRNKNRRAAADGDKGLSIEQLMNEQGKAALNDPREYQLELFERAKTENTIAVLETGSGKTLIAVLLIRYVLDQELEDRAKGMPHRTTFFMVPSNTLVYQQTAVLKCNMDYAIASRCGDMNANDSIERAAWEKRLAENVVVVCTPEILNQCLRHSLVTMDRINLLVFDEAHHAKKNHPYAKIIADFYKIRPGTAPTETRPRVFGMTASPIDAKVDLIAASRELESLLDCKIATYPLAEEYRNQAKEVTLRYQRLSEPFKTRLHVMVEEQVGNIPAFERYFETSKYLSSQLGAWAAERYWHHAFRTEDLARLLGKLSKAFGKWKMDVASTDAQEVRVRRAFQIVDDYTFRRPKANLDDLSTKVEQLHLFLTEHYDKDLKNRCIIFVEQKATARMLVEIFNEIGAKYLKPGLLTGHAAKEGDARVSFRQQVLTMTAFRKGTINCLFATSVAEEGLDVPDCNLVIRFDLYKTVIQYVQSKGRARHKNSKFVELCEELNQRETSVRNEARLQEMKLKHWIGNLDPSRRIGGDEGLVKDEPLGRYYVHHVSKATLTYHNALGVLSLFSSTMPTEDKHAATEPQYFLRNDHSAKFLCEVVMPPHAPIRSAFGLRYPRKALAKRSAAFEMCIQLLRGKFLDSSLLSKYKKLKPEGANAHLAVSEKKTGKYLMRLKPELWSLGRGEVPHKVYLTVIDMKEGLSRPHQPIGLVTRHELPQFPSFPLFLDSGELSFVVTTPCAGFEVTDDEVVALTRYTLMLLLHVNAKKFEENPANMSYWIVPVICGSAESRDCIDWDAIGYALKGEHQQWTTDTPAEFLVNKFIVDPWAGNRRFFSERLRPDLKPLDDIPDGTAKYDRPGANKKKNILQYSISLFGKSFENGSFSSTAWS